MSDTTSAKTLAIRAKAGNPNTTCCVCGRAPGNPFRVFDARGKVTSGCIDATHTGQLVSPSESNYWHLRPEAKQVRRNALLAIK